MFANRFMASVIGIALGVTGAVAIAHSPAETHINNSFLEAKQLDVECPKIEWPYGCPVASRSGFANQTFVDAEQQSQAVFRGMMVSVDSLVRWGNRF